MLRIYATPEKQAHYPWRHGVMVGAAVALGLMLGPLALDALAMNALAAWPRNTGPGTPAPGPLTASGSLAAMGAWFIGLAVVPRRARGRFGVLAPRLLILTTTTALGALLAPSWIASVVGVAVLCLAIPLPRMGITPLITFLMALQPAPGIDVTAHALAFGVGGALALVLLTLTWNSPAPDTLTPASPHAAPTASDRTVDLRHAVRVCATVLPAYLLAHLCGLPHANWLLVGILTTLRSTWPATRDRVVKRSLGMVGGALISAGVIALAPHLAPGALIALAAVLGAAARPLRQLNYGLWPVLGTPVLLLLVTMSAPLDPADAALRLGANVLGAALALVAGRLLWPRSFRAAS